MMEQYMMIGYQPGYLSSSLEDIYDRLYIHEMDLILEIDSRNRFSYKKWHQFLKDQIKPKLDETGICQRKSAFQRRLVQLTKLLEILYECLNNINKSQLYINNAVEKYKNDLQVQEIEELIREFEQEQSQINFYIENLVNLPIPNINDAGISSDHHSATIDYTVLKNEIAHYFTRKIIEACQKRGFKPNEIRRLIINFSEARKTESPETFTISFNRLKDKFYEWLDNEQSSFVAECIEIGIDSSIFEKDNVLDKTKDLVNCCQQSPVVLHNLIYYGLKEGCSLRDFTVDSSHGFSA